MVLHAYVAQAVEKTNCPLLKPSACLFDADVRHNAVSALYSIRPCPSLLQPAGQLWHSQQQQQQSNFPEQTLPVQSTPQQHLSPSKETLPQHSAPQQTGNKPSAEYAAVLPPLPESRVSMLRQQARLHSLHLSEDAEEEEQTVPDTGTSKEEEEGRDNIHMPAELRVCCCQHMVFRCNRSISQHHAWQ